MKTPLESTSANQPKRRSKILAVGLLILGLAALGLGGAGAAITGGKFNTTMDRVDQLNDRLKQAAHDRNEAEAQKVYGYAMQDMQLAREQKDTRNLYGFTGIGGGVTCVLAGVLFMIGRRGAA